MHRIACVFVIAALGAAVAAAQDSRPTAPPGGGAATVAKRNWGLAKPVKVEADYDVHGALLADLPVVPLATLAKEPAAWQGKKVQVRGDITSVCPKKGCWMMVREGDQDVRVTFVDYSFFVPLDAAGRQAAAEGVVTVKVETEAERRHYAEDAGSSAEEIAKIKGDKTTLSIVAGSVQIGRLPEIKDSQKPGKDAGAGDAGK